MPQTRRGMHHPSNSLTVAVQMDDAHIYVYMETFISSSLP